MFITKKHLSRRTVLRGVGAAIALPLLDAMIPAGTALAKTAARPNPRLGFIYFPHGAVMSKWTPATTGTGFEMPEILKPLEPYRSYLTIVSNLRNKGAESPTPHAITAGTWLNCVAPAVSHSPRAGITADQVAAQQIGQDTPLPSLELSGEGGGGPCDPSYGCSYGNTISFRTPTQPLPMEYNPRKVFYRLFGQGDTDEERRQIIDEQSSILDAVRERASALQRELGAADRARVDQYFDSIREIERRIQNVKNNQEQSDLELPEAPIGIPTDFEEYVGLMFDMIALAWQANLTRVVTFMMGKEVSMRTFNKVGVSDAFHPLSHHQNNPQKLEKLVRVQQYHTQCFAKFVKRLAETEDGDGSLLDHSIILYGSNMSNSDAHDHDPLPSAILGRGYGRIKGGQHLSYPKDTPLANLLVTLLHRAGIEIEKLGDSTGTFAEV
ncbi:MAG: DUF1552 domain-containing protein [Pseudomonadota bacterium]|jgi:Protein of unknown function (DUF1552).|nr:MAG: hypothetical protein DIU56_08225 [Pseudomonadota bacterium]